MLFTELGLRQELQDAVSERVTQRQPHPSAIHPSRDAGTGCHGRRTNRHRKNSRLHLPILHRLSEGRRAQPNRCRALIVTPTRELAAQIQDNVTQYSKYLPLKSEVVFGGVKINPQMQKLRGGVDVLVATPGRLLDLHGQNAIRFDDIEVLVLDEADRMLDMGFIHDIRKIFRLLPPKRQNLLYSATFSPEIRELAKSMVNNPVEISVTPPNSRSNGLSKRSSLVTRAKRRNY